MNNHQGLYITKKRQKKQSATCVTTVSFAFLSCWCLRTYDLPHAEVRSPVGLISLK